MKGIREIMREVRRTVLEFKDTTTNAAKTVEYSHHELHDGRAFVAGYTDADVDTGEVLRIRIQTPNTTRWSHMLLSAITSGAAEGTLIENTTLQHVEANALTAYNRNRNSSNTSGMTLCHTPVGNSSSSSGEGVETILEQQSWGTTGKGASPGFGGTARGSSEWVLAPNTAYLVEIQSLADNNRITVSLDWYEHINK